MRIPYEHDWAAMLLADEEYAQERGMVKGLAFFGAMPEEAEEAGEANPGASAQGD